MTKKTEDMEERMRDVEEFISELRGGRRLFLWTCSALGVVAALALALWDKISGGTQ